VISHDNSNVIGCKSNDKFTNYLSEFEKSLSNYEGNGVEHSKPEALTEQKATLPNLVRLQSSSYVMSYREDLWDEFRKYLINEGQRKHSVRNKVGYAKRYCQILESKDARVLLNLSHGSKVHTMKALASLSKFLGRYDEWLDIVKKYQLKWSKPDKSINVFKSIVDSQSQGNDLQSMFDWIKKVSAVLPHEYKNVLLFNTLTGLRPDEAQKAIWLIKTEGSEYIDRDNGIIKHYQFPTVFLRQTKNAYISIVNDKILTIAVNTPHLEHYYNSLRKRISIKNDFDMNMYYCRKVFATFLRNKGIEPEIIDLLQGRISSSVFVNHYYRPEINEMITKKIRPLLRELAHKLS
jgi:intergrase/recombinase